jgi:hypothetical protein
MNFERNAVESDYDEEYDEKTVYIKEGRTVLVREEMEQPRMSLRQPSSETDEYRGGYLDTESEPQQTTRSRKCVQLPVDRAAAEEQVDMEVDDKKSILNLPKGGWVVNKIKAVPIQTLEHVTATLSTKAPAGEVTHRPQSTQRGWIPRVSKWKNITNDVLTGDVMQTEVVPEVQLPAPVAPRYQKHSPQVIESSVGSDKRKNTKICRFVDIKMVDGKIAEVNKCRSGGTCTYAHTLALWNPLGCRFQDNCRNFATCSFKHSRETKEAYYDRIKKLE